MQSRRKKSRRGRCSKKAQKSIGKTVFQTVTALFILVSIWSVSTSKQPEIRAFCDKIRHYLTYTVDVRSVFKPITENDDLGVNENAH